MARSEWTFMRRPPPEYMHSARRRGSVGRWVVRRHGRALERARRPCVSCHRRFGARRWRRCAGCAGRAALELDECVAFVQVFTNTTDIAGYIQERIRESASSRSCTRELASSVRRLRGRSKGSVLAGDGAREAHWRVAVIVPVSMTNRRGRNRAAVFLRVSAA